MPLTRRGRKMLKAMRHTYGKRRGEQVFYATENKRRGKGIRKGR